MTVSEALVEGLSTTVVGLAIVFSVLLILMIVLKLFEKIFYKPNNLAEKKAEPVKQEAQKPAVSVNPVGDENDEELIAVLTAAVAASLNTSTYNLKIKSYRRVQNNAPAWNKAGLRDTIDSRLN